MSSLSPLTGLLGLSVLLSSAFASPTPVVHRRAGAITWRSCSFEFNTTAPGAVCGNLDVPLDYTGKESSEMLQLDLIKVPATKGVSRGSILFNPGGPGFPGNQWLDSSAALLLAATGGQHDLIGFNPRGTGKTLPVTCFDEQDPQDAFKRLTIEERLSHAGNSSEVAPGRIWATSLQISEACAKKNADKGRFLGTAFVARDIIQIVDALGEDGLLRYWGMSYGTLLGATLIAMFPDRVDKIVLDGVINPYLWWHSYSEDQLEDMDATFGEFLSQCVANADQCPLAGNRRNHTPQDLEASVRKLLQHLKYNPIVIPDSAVLFGYSELKNTIFASMYGPDLWPSLARGLDILLTMPVDTAALAGLVTFWKSIYGEVSPYATFSIRCSDKVQRERSLDDMLAKIEPIRESSWLGGDAIDATSMVCGRWPFEAAERYLGGFDAKTAAPPLIMAKTFDPVTPLVSARNVTAGFGGVLLEIEGGGHASMAQPSTCAFKAVRDYFGEGKLPQPGTKCENDIGYFQSPEAVVEAWANLLLALE
ncbi:hypothetical protein PpBr36_08637 [Pyricularia pennisetigena]|uniref:hypothetical protein n=1 Tax=Pyricularia pennisetigena TaxID=1578925 RepID=UPI00114EAECC|nr:hypothetical protein PpBr36_08637 [Pyricularia pennisetigena]TLS24859.1 hypothetical protein PpBr36_08637 [Pyricularia pennisetigena]